MVTSSAPFTARSTLADTVAAIFRSPATWVFAGLWLASALVLVASGQGFPILGLLTAAGYLLFSLITVAITEPPPPVAAAQTARPRLWVQLGLVLFFIALTAWGGLRFHGVVSGSATIPLWSPLMGWLGRTGFRLFGNSNYLANPVAYVGIPLVALLLAGARLPELGFGRGHRIGRVLLLWCALPFAFFAFALLSGQMTVARLAGRFVSNFMQNGFFEEFLFRGALQTRLRRLWTPGGALVAQALVFGAWHLGLGYSNTGHSGFVPALASTIVYQSAMGIAFGVLFARTRNLLAPSVVHIVVNSVG